MRQKIEDKHTDVRFLPRQSVKDAAQSMKLNAAKGKLYCLSNREK